MAEPTSFNIAPAVQREKREKKESLKKRESHAGNGGVSAGGGGGGGSGGGGGGGASASSLKRKASAAASFPSPMRFSLNPPKMSDFDAPKDDIMVEHEPPFRVPHAERQLYKPLDVAENKRGYRYSRAIADPNFPHKQFYRSTSPPPHYGRLSFEDADKAMHFSTNALFTTNEKGWRMVRSNLCAREGTLYYEIKIHRGVPREEGLDNNPIDPQPHVRFGWARREAPLDAPVGFDAYSYGITDTRFETMHRSRPGKFFHSKKAAKTKSAKSSLAAPIPVTLGPDDQHIREGDVIGVELQLPSLQLQQKIVTGIYNPAADFGDGFDQTAAPLDDPMDVIRDRIPVPYKANNYFEVLDHVASKPMEVYADRTTNMSLLPTNAAGAPHNSKDAIKAAPNPNHESPQLRTLPHSAMRVYKNGNLIGTAFENILAFLPPASAPSKTNGAREGFDDGMTGYFPAVSCFFGGVAELNFGDGRDGFWCPPAHLTPMRPRKGSEDVEMPDAGLDASGKKEGWNPGRRCRPAGDRYKEQVAEDVVWDIIDEVDFFMQDGGYGGIAGSAVTGAVAQGSSRLKEEQF